MGQIDTTFNFPHIPTNIHPKEYRFWLELRGLLLRRFVSPVTIVPGKFIVGGDIETYIEVGDIAVSPPPPYCEVVIRSHDDFIAFMNNPSDWSKYVCLLCNVSLEEDELTKIGNAYTPFSGTFNGHGYTISKATMSSDESAVGLFGVVTGHILNTRLSDVNITGRLNVGALVGYLFDGTIENCHVVGGSVTGTSNSVDNPAEGVGGLVGSAEGSFTIDKCGSSATVTCLATSASYNSGSYVGGLIGFCDPNPNYGVTRSYATGNVRGAFAVGGLIGYMASGFVSKCFSTGSLINGIVDIESSCLICGGLIGWTYSTYIENCYSHSNLSGLWGEYPPYYVGGLASSYMSSITSVTNCYSTGYVPTGSYTSACLYGSSYYSSISGVYFDKDTAGREDGGIGCIPKSTAEMYQQSTYENWDFYNIWLPHDGTGYPTLREV